MYKQPYWLSEGVGLLASSQTGKENKTMCNFSESPLNKHGG